MYLAVRLNIETMEEINRKFQELDIDENGILSEEELNQVFNTAMDSEIPVQATSVLFDFMDTNRNGRIEFSEFKACMISTMFYLNEGLLRKAFAFFDRDASGLITRDELHRVFVTYEDVFNMVRPEDFGILIAQVDENLDGALDYDEFVDLMTKDLKAT